MNKCIYCNKQTDLLLPVKTGKYDSSEIQNCCSEECVKKATVFYKTVRYSLPVFAVLLFCSVGLMLARALEFTKNDLFLNGGLLLLGATLIIFPFANGIEFMGIKKSKIIMRFLGIFIIVLSALFLLL